RSNQSPPLYRQPAPLRPNALHSQTTAEQPHSKHTFQTTTRNLQMQFCKQNPPPQTTHSHHTSCIINDRRLPAAYTGVMMSIHKLSAADGYLYYMKEVTSGDDVRQRGQSMSDYSLETGIPSRRWMGSGAHHLGLDGIVKERQMELLF